MKAERIAYVVNVVYHCLRDCALWAVVLYLLNAPEWAFGAFGVLAGVWCLLLLKGTATLEARKRPSNIR
jgi:hypothetical protein